MPDQCTKSTVLVGRRFGRLVVLGADRPIKKRGGHTYLVCICDCGTTCRPTRGNILLGKTKSCGCLRNDTLHRGPVKHGLRSCPEYPTWLQMKQRCTNPKNKHYADYGGRGIVMCEAWSASFVVFYRDMGPRPSPRHSIDRIDNDGPYASWNCRWATPSEQASNKRPGRLIEFQGQYNTLSEWARQAGISAATLLSRIQAGWNIQDALTVRVRAGQKFKREPAH